MQQFKPQNSLSWLQSVNEQNFNDKALDLFYWQAQKCSIYKTYLQLLGVQPTSVQTITDIPFLPIETFKKHKVYASQKTPDCIFESSGTTGQVKSKHYVADTQIYDWTGISGFQNQFGQLEEWTIYALLPSYLERTNASLVYMVQKWIEASNNSNSGFYLNNLDALHQKLKVNNKNTLLIGVSFALLELAEKFPQDLSNIFIMETGGMKGRRKEMIRAELHDILKAAFHKKMIHSEYGMTELLSQAYTNTQGYFSTPPYMKALIRSITDPFEITPTGKGALNIIDLANIYSCAFIETQDAGAVYENGTFEVLGRMDQSEARGCNLMVI